MFAVIVKIHVARERIDEFMPLMRANAKRSLNDELGCVRFDVLTDPDHDGEIVLYELYTDADAFRDHLATPHFKTFDAAVSGLILSREIDMFSEVYP